MFPRASARRPAAGRPLRGPLPARGARRLPTAIAPHQSGKSPRARGASALPSSLRPPRTLVTALRRSARRASPAGAMAPASSHRRRPRPTPTPPPQLAAAVHPAPAAGVLPLPPFPQPLLRTQICPPRSAAVLQAVRPRPAPVGVRSAARPRCPLTCRPHFGNPQGE